MRRFARVGRDVQVFSGALILKPEMIELDDGVRIDDFCRIEGGMGLKIGKYVHIASYASISGGGQADIGDYCGISQGARLITGTGHPFEGHFAVPPPSDDVAHIVRGRLVLGRYTFLGVNAVVMPNITIGEGAVVGAAAVVTKDIEPWRVVVGIPARVIRVRTRFG
jgi:galactoside O-acetyltransferase